MVYFGDEDLGGCMMNFLYVIQKPCSMTKWFTTNPDIAGYASREGWSVKCIKEDSKIIQ